MMPMTMTMLVVWWCWYCHNTRNFARTTVISEATLQHVAWLHSSWSAVNDAYAKLKNATAFWPKRQTSRWHSSCVQRRPAASAAFSNTFVCW